MELSWSELLVVAIVALVVIGPKDLPGMFRELGRFTAKIRAMGREFSRAMEQAAKESGVKDVADDLRKVTNPKAMGLDAVRSAADKFEKWDPMKPAASTIAAAKPAAAPLTPPPMPAPVAAAPGPATAALAEGVAAKRAASAEVSAKLRASKAAAPPATPPKATPPVAKPPVATAVKAEAPVDAPPAKPRGRVRKKPEAGTGDAT
jgi:sec-independent protein translocase protein TatB